MVLVLLAIPALSLLFLQNRQVQTQVAKLVADRLSEELQASITLSSVNYSFFKRIQVRELYVEDLYGDTLLYSELTKLRIKQLNSERKGAEIRKITVENAYVNFVLDSSNVINLSYITDRMKKPHFPPEKKNRLHIAHIELIDSRFRLSKMVKSPVKPEVNFTDMELTSLNIEVKDLISFMDTVEMDIATLNGIEKSGFKIGQLTSHLSVGKKHLHFTDIKILTEGSDMDVPILGFNFEHFNRFKYFSREVDLTFDSDLSLLELSDLDYFVPGNSKLAARMAIDGSVSGKLSDMRGEDLFVTFNENSTLACDFVMIGLPDFNNTFLDFNFKELNTSVIALYDIMGQVDQNSDLNLYPWINLNRLDFKGRFTGYPDNFVANGLLNTDMGRMIMDLSFKPDSIVGVDFKGHLKTSDFKFGDFLDQEQSLAQLDMDIFADGSLIKGQIQADLNGTIDTLEFSRYAYSNIMLDGTLTNNTFDGGFSISDPNIKMDFLGKMDFSGEVPVYNFTADVARARPYFLNLPQEDPNYFVSFLVETDLSGRTVDNMNGELYLVNSLFEKSDGQLQLYDVKISTRNTPDSSRFQITSEMFDATIEGKYQLSTLPASFRSLADRYINVVPNQKPENDSVNQFSMEADFKHLNPLLDFFFPAIKVGNQSHIQGIYDPSGQIQASGYFPGLQIGSSSWSNVDLFAEVKDEEFQLHIQSDSMTYGKNFSLVEQQIELLAFNDTVHLDVKWDNGIEPRYSGDIRLNGVFQPDSTANRGFEIGVEPTSLYINNDRWEISSSSILLRKQFFQFDSLYLGSSDKYLMANGTISSSNEQDFDLKVKNLNLAELSNLAGINAELTGNISGNINYQQLEGNPYIFSDLSVDTLIFNRQMLGPTLLNAAWNDSQRTINMNLLSEMDDKKPIEVDGTFAPGRKLLDFDIHLTDFELQSLNPYIKSVISNLDGNATVDLSLEGTLDEPELNGTVNFNNGAATLSLLNTRYIINDQLRITKNNIYFDDFIAMDGKGNSASINGSLSNTYLKDFYTNINIETNNLMCMNTGSLDNDVLYGSIYATGSVNIDGQFDDIKIGITATTEPNTALYLPLYSAREIKSSDFIIFIQEINQELVVPMPDQMDKISGLEVEMELEITEDAIVQLIFDPKVGDIIETSGRGNLRIMLGQTDGLRMFGDVELMKGNYLFTLQNVINKRFQIESGGKINFNGAPRNTTIDLEAIYTTRAAPYNLYPGDPSEAESLKKRIPVECRLNLQGDLQSPNIVPGIEMPTADPETRNLLVNSTSTEEEMMKQFLSLLVINNFYSVAGYGAQDFGTMNSSIAGVTASELLSNQLSNWLSQISDDFDVGFNYRPGDEVSSQEVEVALSTQLLDDRIIISGNVDVRGQDTNPSSGASNNPYFMGDFDVEFKVTDNVSIIAFNRARDELIFETAPYKQGVGVSYKEQFNDLPQLMERYREGISNRKKKRKKSKKSESEE